VADPHGSRKVRIELTWIVRDPTTLFGPSSHCGTLSLPLSIPDDRRAAHACKLINPYSVMRNME
jgi:hypothetical protein